jgi:hypothetical protein
MLVWQKLLADKKFRLFAYAFLAVVARFSELAIYR